jgi:hypothetical protein
VLPRCSIIILQTVPTDFLFFDRLFRFLLSYLYATSDTTIAPALFPIACYYVYPRITLFIKYFLNIPIMVVYSCKECGELNYLTPHAFWNTIDFGAKCEKCETINTITLENGELKKQE